MHSVSQQAQYRTFVTQIKQEIRSAKSKAVRSVNRQLIDLYFTIGQQIVAKQEELGWGRSVVEQMAKDLQEEFGKRSGFSSANLWRMRNFYLAYADLPNLAQAVRDLPWSHNILILEKCKDPDERKYYIINALEYGWSCNVLTHHIQNDLYHRDKVDHKQNNFTQTLPKASSEMADEMMKSEYNLAFLGISKEFYLNLVNGTVKMPHENSAIGIILCSDKDEIEVEYAIQNMNQPLGVSTYTIEPKLPSELEQYLPNSEEIKKVFQNEK